VFVLLDVELAFLYPAVTTQSCSPASTVILVDACHGAAGAARLPLEEGAVRLGAARFRGRVK
jgi:hypothetical protein